MKRRRRGVSLGTIVMLLLTVGVVVGCAAFLSVIAGDGVYAHTGEILARLGGREQKEPAYAPAGDAGTPEPRVVAEPASTGKETPPSTPVPQAVSFTLAAAGTVYAPKSVRQSALESGDHYDFSPVFAGLGDCLKRADLAVVTLETTTVGREEGYGNYNTPPQILDALRDCGVDVVSLGTERALDKGYEGLDLTAGELTARGLTYAGASPSGGDAGVMVNIGGVQVAVLAYTYGLSDEGKQKTKSDERGVMAMIDTTRMTQDIVNARVRGANVVVVLPHWGTKNKQETPDNVRALAYTLAKAGADVILGTHPNVVQGTERLSVTRTDGLTYDCVVCYSLGSLLTDARTKENTAGMVASLDISYDPVTRRTSLGRLSATPVYIARQREGSRSVYRIVNAEDEQALSSLEEDERQAAQQSAQIVHRAAGM